MREIRQDLQRGRGDCPAGMRGPRKTCRALRPDPQGPIGRGKTRDRLGRGAENVLRQNIPWFLGRFGRRTRSPPSKPKDQCSSFRFLRVIFSSPGSPGGPQSPYVGPIYARQRMGRDSQNGLSLSRCGPSERPFFIFSGTIGPGPGDIGFSA